MKEQFSGRGVRVLLRFERREMVARKCSGRSWVGGGGCGRGVVALVVGGLLVVVVGGFWSLVAIGFVLLEVAVDVGLGEKGVRRSEGGIRGKETVEKR